MHNNQPHSPHTIPRARSYAQKIAVLIVSLAFLLTACTSLTVDMPLSRDPAAPIARVISKKLFFDSAVTFSIPEGPQIAYTSQVNDALAIGIVSQIGPIIARLTDLANSQAAAAATAAIAPALEVPTTSTTPRR